MNRIDEYKALLSELDGRIHESDAALAHAVKKDRYRKMLIRPAISILVLVVCFTALINLSDSAALACSKIPLLGELAEAVDFSRSLTDAVMNDFVQSVEQYSSLNEIDASVEHLIVDQKQVTVFFRVNSDKYSDLHITPDFKSTDPGKPLSGFAYQLNDLNVPNGQLQSVTADFLNGDVPSSLILELKVWDQPWQEEATLPAAENFNISDAENNDAEPEYIAVFDFTLKFDPYYTAAARHIQVDRTVKIDSQSITITDMEIYPSHLSLNISSSPENTAYLKSLDFYITANGQRFDTVINGITAVGTQDSPEMCSYRVESPYFYEAESFEAVITGAEWLDKDRASIRIDLSSGQADDMPEGTKLAGVQRKGSGWLVAVLCKMPESTAENTFSFQQVFMGDYYDEQGREYSFNSWAETLSYNGYPPQDGYFYEIFTLNDYPYDQVWLSPRITHTWQAADPIVISLIQ